MMALGSSAGILVMWELREMLLIVDSCSAVDQSASAATRVEWGHIFVHIRVRKILGRRKLVASAMLPSELKTYQVYNKKCTDWLYS